MWIEVTGRIGIPYRTSGGYTLHVPTLWGEEPFLFSSESALSHTPAHIPTPTVRNNVPLEGGFRYTSDPTSTREIPRGIKMNAARWKNCVGSVRVNGFFLQEGRGHCIAKPWIAPDSFPYFIAIKPNTGIDPREKRKTHDNSSDEKVFAPTGLEDANGIALRVMRASGIKTHLFIPPWSSISFSQD
jgi:hypothetical protein